MSIAYSWNVLENTRFYFSAVGKDQPKTKNKIVNVPIMWSKKRLLFKKQLTACKSAAPSVTVFYITEFEQ